MRLRRYRNPAAPLHDPVREKILDAAAKLFAAQGFAATSVEQVVAQCAIGKDTLYRRFPSKLALFEAMALREKERCETRFGAFMASEEGPTLAQLKRAARWLLDVNLEPRLIAYKRIAFSEARMFGQAAEQATSPITDALVALVTTLQAAGQCRRGDPVQIVAHLTNALILAPMMQAMLGSAMDREMLDAYFERNWNMLVEGIGCEQAIHD